MTLNKINLLGLEKSKLQEFFFNLGEKSFLADQVMQWIYHGYCSNFNRMTNLKKSLREKLCDIAEIRAPIIMREQLSSDGTMKWRMQVDQQEIETVYIPGNQRATLCISSQIGCSLGCKFCGTGKQGFNRNLYTSEIIGQIWQISKLIALLRKNIGEKKNIPLITHIVFMGMGEPLLNLTNVISAVNIIFDNCGFRLPKRNIVLSTAGIVPAIDKLKDIMHISLAISLHAPNDEIRNKIMPINLKYNIDKLLHSVRCYVNNFKFCRNNYVTIEYILLKYINDEASHAYQLVKKLKNIPCKVNLIPWNPVSNVNLTCSSDIRIYNFLQILLQNGIVTIIRKIRGADIDAACGQLTGSVINKMKCNFANNVGSNSKMINTT